VRKTERATAVCQIRRNRIKRAEAVRADSVARIIRNSFAGRSSEEYICRNDPSTFRSKKTPKRDHGIFRLALLRRLGFHINMSAAAIMGCDPSDFGE
jgi:hypothetical protein